MTGNCSCVPPHPFLCYAKAPTQALYMLGGQTLHKQTACLSTSVYQMLASVCYQALRPSAMGRSCVATLTQSLGQGSQTSFHSFRECRQWLPASPTPLPPIHIMAARAHGRDFLWTLWKECTCVCVCGGGASNWRTGKPEDSAQVEVVAGESAPPSTQATSWYLH